MANTTAVHFEPTTDTFGHLTLQAHRGIRALPMNLLLVLAFISAVFVFLTSLAIIDQAAFAHGPAAPAVYEGVLLDYD